MYKKFFYFEGLNCFCLFPTLPLQGMFILLIPLLLRRGVTSERSNYFVTTSLYLLPFPCNAADRLALTLRFLFIKTKVRLRGYLESFSCAKYKRFEVLRIVNTSIKTLIIYM
jgi:hypothetical protein